MFVDFEKLEKNSRIWIYQANRPLSTDELAQIEGILQLFLSNWKRHGEPLKASFKIVYKQFIILGVDENYRDVSGCSIDASVQIVKELESRFKIDLLNKLNIAFKDGQNINTVSLKQFKEFIGQNKIQSDTIVFNNMISSKKELEDSWEVEANKSWHSRFFN